jgi:SET domain-containing protein
VRQTRLAHYYFEWGGDCQEAAIALGYGSLYNHSYMPNARYVFRESEECLEFIALRDIEAGDIVERAPVIVIPREDLLVVRQTRLAHYYFEWGGDCQQAAIALGYGSLYNHSYRPNARYVFRESEECLEFIALRDIEAGEEITINYNNLEESAANAVKFEVR